MKKVFYIFCFSLLFYCSAAQKIQKEKYPKKAAIYSAIIPGSGQIYTKTYWKVPIIYGGMITSVYYIHKENKSYNKFKDAAIKSNENNNSTQLVDGQEYSYNDLKSYKDLYRRNRDISYLCFIGVYILNIVDASVNAHLYQYDISDDISLDIDPAILFNQTGISLTVNL